MGAVLRSRDRRRPPERLPSWIAPSRVFSQEVPLHVDSLTARRPRALVVDDDPIVLHVLTALLGEGGIDCIGAPDGRAGLRRLSDEILSLDLLVTDLSMPELPGDALVMAVRELGGERELPIVVVSCHVDPLRAAALRTAGADAVVDKAFGLEPVVGVVRELLAARGLLSCQVAPASREAAPAGLRLGRIPLERQRP